MPCSLDEVPEKTLDIILNTVPGCAAAWRLPRSPCMLALLTPLQVAQHLRAALRHQLPSSAQRPAHALATPAPGADRPLVCRAIDYAKALSKLNFNGKVGHPHACCAAAGATAAATSCVALQQAPAVCSRAAN